MERERRRKEKKTLAVLPTSPPMPNKDLNFFYLSRELVSAARLSFSRVEAFEEITCLLL